MIENILFRKSYFFGLLLLFLLSSCNNPSEADINYSFEMYYLSDSNISYSDAETQPLDKIELESIPFITAKDIKTYTINYIVNNPTMGYKITLKDSVTGDFADDVQPFVMVINGRKFALAEYWPGFMSIVPKSIFMYRSRPNEYHLHTIGEVGNEKLKDTIVINTLYNLGIEIIYRNIGGK